jgi:DNA-binding ferritin-like protein
MFGFTQKRKKKRAAKKNDNRVRIKIEEIDTPDTPTPEAVETIPAKKIKIVKDSSSYSPIILTNNSNSNSRSRSRSRSRGSYTRSHSQKFKSVAERTPTPYHAVSKPSSPIKINSPGEMILFFMGMLNTVKLYHWKTFSFATHKATDELYEDLNKYVDEFVEVMLGYHGGIRAKLPHTNMKMNDFSTPEQFKNKLDEYKKTLISYTQKLDPVQNSDLLNIRDEILAALNKTAYLLSFRGGGK